MSTNGSHTATVQALTAEVKVLMVGSRQVTMSVYNQLDTVRWDYITIPYRHPENDEHTIPPPAQYGQPFGRVHPRGARENYVYIVGCHQHSGALVRSEIIDPDYLYEHRENGRYSKLRFERNEDWTIPTEPWMVRRSTNPYRTDDWNSNYLHLWPPRINWHESALFWEYFTNLPLIVLAGLR